MARRPAYIRKSLDVLARTEERARELLSSAPVPTFEPLFRTPEPSSPPGLADKSTDQGQIVDHGRADEAWRAVQLKPGEIGVEEIRDEEWLTDPYLARDRFGLKSIEFGNWLNEYERQTYLYGSMQGLDDMSRVLGIPHGLMGFDGRLSIALGARGQGNQLGKGAASGHFEPGKDRFVINLAYSNTEESEKTMSGKDPMKKGRRMGKGTLAHEWGHALDHFAGGYEYASGGPHILWDVDDSHSGMRNRFEQIFRTLLWTEKENPSAYQKGLKKLQTQMGKLGMPTLGNYYCRRTEIFARLFESMISYLLEAEGITNHWVSKPSFYLKDSALYPSRAIAEGLRPILASIIEDVVILGDPEPQSKPKPSRRSTPKLRGSSTEIETRDGMIPAYYSVVELESVIPSHNPHTWSKNAKYPDGCQQRDYTSDKAEQRKVEQGAQKLNPKFLLSDTPSPLDGPPIVVVEGEIYTLGGNGRTMMAQLSDDSIFNGYVDELRDRADSFGVTEEEIDALDRPFLVRVITVPIDQCALYSNKLNKGLTQDVDLTTETVSWARQLSVSDLERLAATFDAADVESLAEALRSRPVQKDVLATFRAAGIVNDQNSSQWIDPATKDLSPQGRLWTERVLLGAILRDKALIDAAQSYTSRIVRSLPMMIRMQTLPREWDLTGDIEEVIRLESRRRASGQSKKDMLSQSDAFAERVDPRVESVWTALDAGSLKWKAFLEDYVRQAEREAQIEREGGFGLTQSLDPQAVIDRLLGREGLADPLCSDPPPKGDSRLITLRDVAHLDFRGLILAPRWYDFLGEIPTNWAALIAGRPGSGKSTMTLELADELTNHRRDDGGLRRVLYAAVEEAPGAGGFLNRSQITGARSERVVIFDKPTINEIRAEMQSGGYDALVLDSGHSITNDFRKLVELRKEFPDKMFLALSGMWKNSNQVKGNADLEHEVDTVILVEDGTATTSKNRFRDVGKALNIFHR